MSNATPAPEQTPDAAALAASDAQDAAIDELESILDDLRSRYDETPQWEFCDGFLAALVCCRTPIAMDEYLDVLLGIGATQQERATAESCFADAQQEQRFKELWSQRWQEVRTALDTPVESLDDEAAFHPHVMDLREAYQSLSAEERKGISDQLLPSFGQVWALGFMYAVEAWPQEWVPPRDREAAKWLDASLQALVALTEDDEEPPTLSPLREDGPPTTSEARLQDFAAAVWAVYDLREIWRSMGPRIPTFVRAETPGRNDPCSCGSGKKFKKCCGA